MSKDFIYKILAEISDPEIPVISIIDLGVVRDVIIDDSERVEVVITPTYSGCPAMKQIESDIVSTLTAHGFSNVKVKYSIFPPWTTEWLNESTKEKLKNFGIAPPEHSGTRNSTVNCPFCNSDKTVLKSRFSSTACKELHYCNECNQPFEKFKCH